MNDTPRHAHTLGGLLRSRRADVLLNLIPYNPTEAGDRENYKAPSQAAVDEFFAIVTSLEYGVFTRMRQEMGQDVAAACGQLAVENKRKHESSQRDIEDNFPFYTETNGGRLLGSQQDTVSGLQSMEDCSEGSDRLQRSSDKKSSWSSLDVIAATAITTGVLLGAIFVYRASRISR